MKEMYNQAPDEWIVLWAIPIGWMNHGKWCKSKNPTFIDENYYKLIHIKHKDILDAYLADKSVDIEVYIPITSSNYNIERENGLAYDTLQLARDMGMQSIIKELSFIEEYNPDMDYRIKEKKDEDNRTSDDTDTTMDDSVDSANTASKMTTNMVSNEAINSFTAHGFEVPDFAGEILKEIDGFYIGYVKDDVGFSPTAERWTKEGKHMNDEIADEGYNLTPIKNHWYENPNNFPALVSRYNLSEAMLCPTKEYFLEDLQPDGFELATKAELMSLYYKED